MKSKLTYCLVAFGFVVMVGILHFHTNITRVPETTQEASLFTAMKNFFFPPSWSPEDCPSSDGQYGLVYNGGFEFGVPDNTSFTVSSLDSSTMCGWTRNFLSLDATWQWVGWNYGTRYFSFTQQQDADPVILHEDIYMLADDGNNQRYVGLTVAEHTYSEQSHDFLMQQISGLIPNQQYVLTFDFSVEVNVAWPWPQQVGGVPNLGVAALLLSDVQIDNLSTSLNWTTWAGDRGIYFLNELRDYATPQEFLNTLQTLTQSEYIHTIYLSDTNEFSRTAEVGDIMQFEASFVAPDTEFRNLVIMPLGYDPEYVGAVQWKAKSVLTLNDVAIYEAEQSPQLCSFVYTGKAPVYAYYESGLTLINTGDTVHVSQLQNYSPGLAVETDAIIIATLGEGVLDVVTPNNVTLSEDELFSLFDFENISVNFTFGSGGHHYFEYECPETCELVGDLNTDGLVSVLDVSMFNSIYGTMCDGVVGCVGDLDGDGIIGVSDFSLLLQSIGSSCEEFMSIDVHHNPAITKQFLERPYNFAGEDFNYAIDVDFSKHKASTRFVEIHIPTYMNIDAAVSNSRGVILEGDILRIPSVPMREDVTVYLNITLDKNMCRSIKVSTLFAMFCE